MSEATEPLLCARCLAELTPGSGDFYQVTIDAVADASPPVLDEPPSRAELRQEIEDLIRQMEGLSGQEAMDQVHRRLTLHLGVQVRDTVGGMEIARLVYANLQAGGELRPVSDGLLVAQDEAIRRKLAVPFRELHSEVPQLGLSLLVSPLDAEFAPLIRLSDPLYVRDILAADPTIHSQASGSPPDARHDRRQPVRVRRRRPPPFGAPIAGILWAWVA